MVYYYCKSSKNVENIDFTIIMVNKNMLATKLPICCQNINKDNIKQDIRNQIDSDKVKVTDKEKFISDISLLID